MTHAPPRFAPLTAVQQGTLFHARYDTPDLYVGQVAANLVGEVDPGALRAAAARLTDRIAALRTFVGEQPPGEPVLAVAAKADLPWRELDLTNPPAGWRHTELTSILADELTGRPFELSSAPLARAMLVRLSPHRHVLALTYHRLVFDIASASGILSDLLAADTALAPAVPSASVDREAALAAWRATLAGLREPSLLLSGASAVRPAWPSRLTVSGSPALAARLAGMARRHHLAEYDVMLGAWALVLGALTGEDDVVFGLSAGQPTAITPVRVALDPKEPLADLVGRTRASIARLDRYRQLGLAVIKQCVGTGSDELFDTVLVAGSAKLSPHRGGPRVTSLEAVEYSQYPLTITCLPGARLLLDYQPQALSQQAARSIGERLLAVAEAIAAFPRRRAGSVDVLLELERKALAQFSVTATGPPPATLPAMFGARVRAAPAGPAVSHQGQATSYAELDARANRLARALLGLGAGPEQVVAIALPPSVELVTAILAVLKAGSAYLPIDPGYPPGRASQILADAKPGLLITVSEVTTVPAGYPARRLVLDDPAQAETIGRQADTSPDVPLSADHPAYVIYTSGSTGRPKGVVVPHRGLAGLVAAQTSQLGAGPGSRVLQFASPSFDASVWEICMALLTGGTLVLPPDGRIGVLMCPDHAIAAQQVSHVTLPPSALAVLPAQALSGVRALVAAGEILTAELAARWSGQRTMVNAYGPTEFTVCATLSTSLSGIAAPPIGRPVPGTRILVLDAWLREVPAGVTGELYLTGSGLARGYLGQPALTAGRFIAARPGTPGERMYRTGDLVRWDEADGLRYVGRLDQQVKVRGFRVEPSEVEAFLSAHPSVGEAAVVAGARSAGDQRLVAYVTGMPRGQPPDPAVLGDYARAGLPGPMVPAAVTVVPALPRNPNGKVDRRALLAAAGSALGAPPAAPRRRPRTPREQLLCELVCEVAGVGRVAIDDNLRDLGFDSLTAMRLAARIQAVLGTRVPIRAVVEAQSVTGLISWLGGHTAAARNAGPSRRGELREEPVMPAGSLTIPNLADPKSYIDHDMTAVWRELRAKDPVYRHPSTEYGPGFWVLSRHEDVAAVLQDPGLFTSEKGNVLVTMLAGGDTGAGRMLAVTDGPQHAALRALLLQAFGPRALASVNRRVRRRVGELLREAVRAGECDFARDVAADIPLSAICDLLDVPATDREAVLRLTRSALARDHECTDTEADRVSRAEILLYFSDLVKARRRTPGTDAISLMTTALVSGKRLTDHDIVLNCYSLIMGGDETSRLAMIGGVRALADHPRQWDALRTRQVAPDRAAEEVLRWTTPTMHFGRVATRDVSLRGKALRAGDLVTVWLVSANRDEGVFENPDQFDLARWPNKHLTLGYGPHFCLGAYLGRVELTAMLDGLATFATGITVAGQPQPMYSNFLSGMSSLPVALEAAPSPQWSE